MRDFHGVYVPVPTPFRGDQVATDRLKANLAKWNATDLAGYVVLGSTGEFPMLSEAERDVVLVAAREAIPRGKAFLAGTGANSTLHTIRQTKRAAEIGADAAIVITPHYFTKGFAQAGAQVRHYVAVAEASPIPVMLYNFPLNTGINLEPDTVARIAEHPNVCGIKDSSGNIPQAAHVIHLTPKTPRAVRGVRARARWAMGRGQGHRRAHDARGPGSGRTIRHRRAQGRPGPAGLLWRAVPGAPRDAGRRCHRGHQGVPRLGGAAVVSARERRRVTL